MNTSIQFTPSSAWLFAICALLLIAWRIARSRRIQMQSQQQNTHISVSQGGVVVGGNNTGLINTGQINSPKPDAAPAPASGAPMLERLLAIAGTVVGLVSLYLVFFPPGVAGK